MQVAGFSMIPLDISDFPTRHNYGLALWQSRFEEILAGWIEELAVRVHRGREVTGFAQDATGVEVALSGGGSLRGSTSSAVTAAAAWSVRRPASTSRAGTRRSASWSPRSR